MAAKPKRNSLLCPNCRKLVGRDVAACPHCGLKKPGSLWHDNIFSRRSGEKISILRLILLVNITMYCASLLIDLRPSAFSSSPFTFLSPTSNALFYLGSSGAVPLFEYNRWWSLLSANYLHGSLMHIGFNMIALHQLGPLLIKEYGVNRFITIYTLSGVGGYLISAIAGVSLTIGASGCVCGLIGAALYYGKSRGGGYGQAIYSQIGSWAAMIFLFGFLVPGINNWGHGGGMLVGALLGYMLGYADRKRENQMHRYLSMFCIFCTAVALVFSGYWAVLYLLN